jgi:hypothetical protein
MFRNSVLLMCRVPEASGRAECGSCFAFGSHGRGETGASEFSGALGAQLPGRGERMPPVRLGGWERGALRTRAFPVAVWFGKQASACMSAPNAVNM